MFYGVNLALSFYSGTKHLVVFGLHDNPLIRQLINAMKNQRQGLKDTACCVTDRDPWSAKQHHWKSEAKEDHQLSPGGPSNRRKLRSKSTKMNTLMSRPS